MELVGTVQQSQQSSGADKDTQQRPNFSSRSESEPEELKTGLDKERREELQEMLKSQANQSFFSSEEQCLALLLLSKVEFSQCNPSHVKIL